MSRPNSVIYVSGLPTDNNTEDEFAEFFSKRCGILKIDFETGARTRGARRAALQGTP